MESRTHFEFTASHEHRICLWLASVIGQRQFQKMLGDELPISLRSPINFLL
jgi:hypothetical protein